MDAGVVDLFVPYLPVLNDFGSWELYLLPQEDWALFALCKGLSDDVGLDVTLCVCLGLRLDLNTLYD